MSRQPSDPRALAQLVSDLGGTPVPANSFQFDLPLSEVRDVVPKIHELGVGIRKVREWVGEHPTRNSCPQTICRLEAYYRKLDD
jgi:hypothetical protein